MKKILIALTAMLVFLSACKKEETKAIARHSKSATEHTMVVIETTMGDITVELFDNDAPITVANFLAYVDSKFYDDTIFHRVISNFMIQCGGFTREMTKKPTQKPIKNEANNGRKNLRGTLAMARTGVVDSATSQFFINVNNNTFLDHGVRDYGYAVFGKVVKGMDVVEDIRSVETGIKNRMRDVPVEEVVIIRIKRLPKSKK